MGIPAIISSVPAQTPYIQYIATSGQTVFPYPFVITQDSDLIVVDNGNTLGTDQGYTTQNVGQSTGGTITFNSGATSGDIITLYRDIPIERITQIGQNSGFSSTAFNAEYNNIYLILQQLEEQFAQCLQIPITNTPTPVTVLLPGTYANKFLSFDANGNPQPAVLTSSGAVTAQLVGGLIWPRTQAEINASIVPTSLIYPPGNILRYGGDSSGISDSTNALQLAVSSTAPVHAPQGTYLLSHDVIFGNAGQEIRGDGHQATFFKVAAATGFTSAVFDVTSGESGPNFHDFCLYAVQPSAPANFAALTSYVPMIYLNASPRTRITDVRVVGGINGVYQNGNCGGSIFTRVELGCFGKNWYTDGNVDVTQWTDCQVWPFSPTSIMTAQQQAVFAASTCVGFYSLRSDYFNWKGGLILCGQSTYFGQSSSGVTYGQFTGTGFDTFGGLLVAAGEIAAINCVFSVGGTLNGAVVTTNNAATHTGGILNISGGNVFLGTGTIANNAVFYSNSTTGSFSVDNLDISLGNIDPISAVVVASTDTSQISITRNRFGRVGTGAYTVPILSIQGGYGVIANNQCLPNISATDTTQWLSIPNSVYFKISNNSNYGWSTSIAGTTVASAGTITIPPIFGDVMPVIEVTGTTTINVMTYAIAGVTSPYAGQQVTLQFAGASTVSNGSVGTAGDFILNGRSNFAPSANSTLTVQLLANGNWQEIGRCA